MTDISVAVSGIMTIVGLWLITRLVVRDEQDRQRRYRHLVGPAIIGYLFGRLASFVFAQLFPSTGSSNVSVIDGGVEIWPGIFAAVGWEVWTSLRFRRAPWPAVAELMAPILVSSAMYEMLCVVRDGCRTGAEAGVGDQFAIRLASACVILATGAIVYGCTSLDPRLTTTLALLSLASVRAIASFADGSEMRWETLYRSVGAAGLIAFLLVATAYSKVKLERYSNEALQGHGRLSVDVDSPLDIPSAKSTKSRIQ